MRSSVSYTCMLLLLGPIILVTTHKVLERFVYQGGAIAR